MNDDMNDDMNVIRRICRKICYRLNDKLSDKLYLQLQYYARLGKPLHLKHPVLFNEKLNWLKLYQHNPKYTRMVDKYEVREFIKEQLGEEYLIPILGVWNSVDEISFDQLPEQFVLKCTHDSASVVICKDKSRFNIEQAKQKLAECMQINYYKASREWPYKDIKPRIIAEQYMVDESNMELKDYKIFCFDGKPVLVQVDFGRFTQHERNLYSTSWEYVNERFEYPNNPAVQIMKPEALEEMLHLAAKLSRGIPSVRIDFYCIKKKVYFGEITFYQEGGFGRFEHESFEKELGDMIKIG